MKVTDRDGKTYTWHPEPDAVYSSRSGTVSAVMVQSALATANRIECTGHEMTRLMQFLRRENKLPEKDK